MLRTKAALLWLAAACAAALLAACDLDAPPAPGTPSPGVLPVRPTRAPTATPRPADEADRRLLEAAFSALLDLRSYRAVVTVESGAGSGLEYEYTYKASHNLYISTQNKWAPDTSRATLALGGRFYRLTRGRWVDETEYETPETLRPEGVAPLLAVVGLRVGRERGARLEPFSLVTFAGEGGRVNGIATRRYSLAQQSADRFEYGRTIMLWVEPETAFIHRISIDAEAWSVPAERPLQRRGSPTATPASFYTFSMGVALSRHNDPGLTLPDPLEVPTPEPSPSPLLSPSPTAVFIARAAGADDLDLIARAFTTMRGLRSYYVLAGSQLGVRSGRGVSRQYELTWVAPGEAHVVGRVFAREVELLAREGVGYAREEGGWVEKSAEELSTLVTGLAAPEAGETDWRSPEEVLDEAGAPFRGDFQAMLRAGARVEAPREVGVREARLRRFRISYPASEYASALATASPAATPPPAPPREVYRHLELLIDPATGYVIIAAQWYGGREAESTPVPGAGGALLAGRETFTYSRHNDPTLEVPTP